MQASRRGYLDVDEHTTRKRMTDEELANAQQLKQNRSGHQQLWR
jgi:hypothetical protein